MDSGILENQLNLALDVPERVRKGPWIWALAFSLRLIPGN